MGINYNKGVIKNIVPIVMAGVLGIYGLIVSVIITQSIAPPNNDQYTTYSLYNGYSHVSLKRKHLFYCSLRCFSHSFDNTIRSWLLACAVGFRVLPLVERLVLSERLVWLALDSRLREESAFGMEWKEVTMVMSVVTLQTRKMPTNSMSACSLCSFSVKLWHYSKSKVYNVNRSCLLSPCSNGFSSKVVWLWLWFWVSVHTTAKFSKFGWVKMSAEHDKRRNLSPCTLLCWWSR